jgi:hypothetical protein
MRQIDPELTLSDLFPSGTVLAPRTVIERMRWVKYQEYQLDVMTGSDIPILGEMPLICHSRVVTGEIREFFSLAGIEMKGKYLLYDSFDEAIHLARKSQQHGQSLLYYYPLPDELANDENLVLSSGLYNWLNDKANIDQLCDPRFLPAHRFFPADEVAGIADYLPDKAVFFKMCHPGVSGGGADVFFCSDDSGRQEAFDWITARPRGWSGVRVEEAVDVRESWCLNLHVGAQEIRYLGAAAQLFSRPACQEGSRIDPRSQPSRETVALAVDIAHRSRRLGFVGVAGFDIGENRAGRPYVFDLNFRFAACTPQVMIHAAAVNRVGGRISQSLKYKVAGPLSPVLRCLEQATTQGKFVPLRCYESSGREEDWGRINGMLIGTCQQEIDELEQGLTAELGELVSPP